VDVLVVLGGTRHVGQVAAGGVLGTLGTAGGATRVLRKRGASAGIEVGGTTARRYSPMTSSTKTSRPSTIGVADAYSPAWRRKTSTCRPPGRATRPGHGLVGLDLVIDQVAVPVVAVDGDQEPLWESAIRSPQAAPLKPPKTSE